MFLHPLDIHTIAKQADKVIWNSIDEEAILLNLNNGYYYTLNPVALEMWKSLDGKRTVRDIAMALCEVYEATQEQIETDILTLLDKCQKEELIVIVDPEKT